MKTKKNIEDFTKYIITEVSSETPSSDFVDKVMGSIKAISSVSTVKIYNPLISKLGWVIITLLIVSICTFVLTSNFENPEFITNFSAVISSKANSLNIFESIKLSKLFSMSFVLFSMFVIFQFVIIKNYFNKQYSA